MFTSGIELKHIGRLPIKTAIVYSGVSLLCVVISNVYAIFGHGIRSDSMDYMFLYPLLGGTVIFLLAAIVLPRLSQQPRVISRIAYNLYNSGIAALTSAAMLKGIVEIAGTGSAWIIYIKTTGIIMVAAAITCSTLTNKVNVDRFRGQRREDRGQNM